MKTEIVRISELPEVGTVEELKKTILPLLHRVVKKIRDSNVALKEVAVSDRAWLALTDNMKPPGLKGLPFKIAVLGVRVFVNHELLDNRMEFYYAP